ncbi:MAG: DEAD/DEAH box helicase, partial [Pseudomonadota bacterium]
MERLGFVTPSPIQARAIGPQLEGRDLLGLAQTGSGKTAAFLLPILDALAASAGRAEPMTARALVLVPTRELAVQIEEQARRFAGKLRIKTQLVLGGMSRGAQIRALGRGVDILIATPGRLTDLVRAGHVRLDATALLVLDEADRLLDMGFAPQVKELAGRLHRRRRTALFSATMPREVTALAEGLLNDPVRVEVAPPGRTVERIDQSVEFVARDAKRARLAALLSAPEVSRAIVFTRTKHRADRVAEHLGKDGVPAGAIHGNKSQGARQRVLDAFRQGQLRVLVASDIVARGIDVEGISHVVQFELPDEPEAYVHRIGRTGRNGAAGTAVALCAPEEQDKLRAIEKLTGLRFGGEGSRHHASAPKGRGGAPKPAPPTDTKQQAKFQRKPQGAAAVDDRQGEAAP